MADVDTPGRGTPRAVGTLRRRRSVRARSLLAGLECLGRGRFRAGATAVHTLVARGCAARDGPPGDDARRAQRRSRHRTLGRSIVARRATTALLGRDVVRRGLDVAPGASREGPGVGAPLS